MSDNKNSFRDMILIIFVVLVCFGITIYGIAYLTGKVFSTDYESEISENDMPKEVTTNPQEGDTITFTTMQEQGQEVMPDVDDIITTVTPPESSNVEVAENNVDNIEVQEEVPVLEESAAQPAPVVEEKKTQEPKKETVKQQTKPAQEPKKQETAKKQEPKKETVKKEPVKKEPVKPVAPKKEGNFVVQITALSSKEAAEKEKAKYRAKFPDVFIKQVQINGKTWYRVRLGVSETKEQAEQVAKRVANEFNIKPIVTKNN